MAEGKNKIMVYRDWLSTFEALSDEEAGRLIKHFFRYVNDLNPEPPDRITLIAFEPIKQTLKRDLKSYEAICLKNKDNVNIRWNKENTTVYDRIRTDTKHTDKDNDKDKEINILFSVFWDAYDKKEGDKKACEKKWNKLTDADRQKIMNTLPAFKSKIKDKQFQPFPATFLNQRRWDNITESKQPVINNPTPAYIDNDWEIKKLKQLGLR